MNLPKPVAVLPEEGCFWQRFGTAKTFHAILFDNRRVFDAVNGWRPKKVPKDDYFFILTTL